MSDPTAATGRLYPTRSRKRVLEAVRAGDVWRLADGRSRDEFGGYVTARMAEMERAEWVAIGQPDDEEHGPWSYTEFGVLCTCGAAMADEVCLEAPRRWLLTATGRAVLGGAA